MQKLHLVGFTTDHRGLIFSVRRGAKSGGYVIHLDDSLVDAVDELRALVAEETAAAEQARESGRAESSLSVREVQARLRRGRSIDDVAREAGVDSAWVARFAVPVLAEQAEIVRSARATKMTKHRVGVSSAALGESVYRNLAERGVTDPRDELDKAWAARQLTDGVWLVTFSYSWRGRAHEATWEYDTAAATLKSRGRLGAQLGYREGGRKPSSAAKASSTTKAAPSRASSAKKSTTTAKSTARATKRVAAARKAAVARMETEAERAMKRNAALARKAARQPLVLPPRRPPRALPPLPPPEPEALLDEADDEEPTGWSRDLELRWDDTARDQDDLEPVEEDDAEIEIDVDVEPEAETETDLGGEADTEPDAALDLEPEPEPEPGVAPGPPRPRRREPLRAQRAPVDDGADRRRIRVRPGTADVPASVAPEPSPANGPVFRADLVWPARDLGNGPAVPGRPTDPLTPPPQPIDDPPRPRRRRPLRGR